MKRLPKKVMVLAALGLGLMSVPLPAQAAATSSAIVYTGGVRAAEAFFNRADAAHANKAWFDVYDAKCDANDVYVEYTINSDTYYVQKYNSGGCGTTKGYNLQSGYFTIKYRVCVDDAFWDTCSGYKTDHN